MFHASTQSGVENREELRILTKIEQVRELNDSGTPKYFTEWAEELPRMVNQDGLARKH